MDDKWLIWSNEHLAWWNPGEKGYTMIRAEAGRYSYEDALRICREGNTHPKHDEEPNETMVLEY